MSNLTLRDACVLFSVHRKQDLNLTSRQVVYADADDWQGGRELED